MATLTLDFTIDVPVGPATLYDVEGVAEVIASPDEAGFEVVAVSLDTLVWPPGQRFGGRYEPVEIGRYRCDYTGRVDAASPMASALTSAIADALHKDDAFCAAVDEAITEARRDARRDAAEARAEERREMAGPCWPSAAMEG
jgi:hypothetical protein